MIGGLQMVDDDEADDKIIAVLENDTFYEGVDDVSKVPDILVQRLRHYFGTYKMVPGPGAPVHVAETYDRARAERVIQAAIDDYDEQFGE